jgi:FixJ family two-component response regulator
MPHMLALAEQYRDKDVKLLLVSLDMPEMYPKKLQRFIKKKKFKAPVVWLNEANADIFCPAIDAKWSGSIPATLFMNTVTGYRKFVEGPMSSEVLEKAIIKAIEARL